MATPTHNLPFEYTQRWTEVGPMLVPSADSQTLNLLNKRDKDLEDYLAGLGGGGGCECSWVYAVTESATMTLAASTYAYADLDFTDILAEEGGWSISAGKLVAPDPNILYHAYAASGLVDGSGTDDVNASLAITDEMTTTEQQNYTPGGWDASPCISRIMAFNSGTYFSIVIQAPAAATRVMSGSVSVMAVATCCLIPVL